MIDHFNLPVSNVDISKAFYSVVLKTLGIEKIAEDGPAVGFGRGAWQFGIEQFDSIEPRLHLAFKATSETEVLEFYAAAQNAGGRSNGEPGLRPIYGKTYFAAYIFDLDGHNIEVVYRGET